MIEEEQRVAEKGSTKPKNETERPRLYGVVYHPSKLNFYKCDICVLQEAFGMSKEQASAHVGRGAKEGQEPVLVSTHEVVEQKTHQANIVANNPWRDCYRFRKFVKFSSEPMP